MHLSEGKSNEHALDELFGHRVEVLKPEPICSNGPQHLPMEVQSHQLTATLEQRARQFNAWYEIGRTLAETLNLHEVYWVMFREIAQVLLDASHFAVSLFDQETDRIYCDFAISDGEEQEPRRFAPVALGGDPASNAIRSRKPRIIDLREFSCDQEPRDQPAQPGDGRLFQSALFVPMVAGDRVVGVMHVLHHKADAFRNVDMQLLSTLACQAAVAITNAQLYANEQERAEALARALAKQKELDRLQNEFLQNVSHELRTPLGIVYGYVELLASGTLGELGAEQQQAVNIITRRVQILRKMVEDFTTILASEKETLPPEPVYLSDLVQTLLDDFQVSAQQSGLTLTLETEIGLPPVLGKANHLRQVLDNLVANALKYTPQGGTVKLRLWRQGADAYVEVIDSGIGIPRDKLDRIFERFYQIDGSSTRRFGGTGLGLALVKEIIEAHDGQVTVQSIEGKGSTFQIRLPLA